MMSKKSANLVKPRTVAWLAQIQTQEEVESVLAGLMGHANNRIQYVLKPDDGIKVHRRDTRLNGKVIEQLKTKKGADEGNINPFDPSIEYEDFSPPPMWQVPYSVLRVRFSEEKKSNFMSHLGEEILLPLASSIGAVHYNFYERYTEGIPDDEKPSSTVKSGEIIRINAVMPHHTWAEGNTAMAWMLFEDASETTPAIRTSANKNMSLQPRHIPSGFFDKHPECYDMVAHGISETIRLYRQRAGFNIAQLAGLCEIDRAHLSKAEDGKSNLSIEALIRIANVLGFDAPSLLLSKPWQFEKKSLDDISKDAQPNPLCVHKPHFLHPRTLRIAKGNECIVEAMSSVPFGTFSSWLVLSGEVIFKASKTVDQPIWKELLQEGAVLHLRRPVNCRIEARVESLLLEVIRSPLCPSACNPSQLKTKNAS